MTKLLSLNKKPNKNSFRVDKWPPDALYYYPLSIGGCILKRFKFFAKWRESRVKKESLENLDLDQSYKNVAFLGLRGRLRSLFNLKKILLNIQIYFRVSIVFLRRLPLILYNFFLDLPKNLKKEGSRIKINKTRFELKKIWPHFGIGILSGVVISSSVFAQNSDLHSFNSTQELIEPVEYADLAISADSYTPFINEKENEMIIALFDAETVVSSDESYILAPVKMATEKSPKVSTEPSSRVGYLTYQVLGGETLSHIGAKFDVSSLSVLWANPDLKNPDILIPGSNLSIPPRDGMTATVEKGQSVESLVKKYSGNFDGTLAANGISDPSTIFAGQKILIANGHPAKSPSPNPKIASKSKGSVKGTISSVTGPTVPSGTFRWPTSGSVCQGMRRGHPAIDICAGGSSPPIVASDGGVVVQAVYGWNYGYGNVIQIDHGSGYVTVYAHLSQTLVQPCQSVGQGTLIGYAGATGNAFGSHLHFEIRNGGKNINPYEIVQ